VALAGETVWEGRGAGREAVGERRGAVGGVLGLRLVIVLAAVVISRWSLWAAQAYRGQGVRMALRDGGERADLGRALFLTLGKFAEAAGILEYIKRQRAGGPAKLIEFK